MLKERARVQIVYANTRSHRAAIVARRPPGFHKLIALMPVRFALALQGADPTADFQHRRRVP